VDYVSNTGVVPQDTLPNVVEKLGEVIILGGANLGEVDFEVSETPFAYSWLSISATAPRSIFLLETKIFTISVTAHMEVQS
jgi:hypothetical protein